jgi:amidophosphoribosyltransferase
MGCPDGRNNEAPQFCDACFTGDYPIALTDRDAQTNEAPLFAIRA